MATIGTTSIADALAPPGCATIARRYLNAGTIYYYAAVRTATDTLSIYRSTDGAASWSSYASFTHTGLQEWSSIVVDTAAYLHVAYRVGTGSQDILYYRRLNLSTAGWSSPVQVSGNTPNSGSIGSRFQGVDLAVFRNPDTSYAIIVAGAYSEPSAPRHGIYCHGVSIEKNAGNIYLNNGIITGTRGWFIAGTPPGRSGVSCETEHNGDGYTTSTPNVWVSWGRSTLRTVKIAWKSSVIGWQGPSSYVTIRSSLPSAQDYSAGRWDGAQWLMAVPNPDDTTSVRVYQRNKANTTTVNYDSPAHPQGVVKNCVVSYNNTTKDIRVYAVGTGTAVLYYVDYVRQSSSWSSWSTVSATAVLGSTEWGVSRGGTSLTTKHEVVLGASGSPNTITHTPQGTSTAPAVPSFVTAGQAYSNGSAANVSAALPLVWTFSDLDPGQTQGWYALSRQIGAGALAYWNATSSTWVASEVQNGAVTSTVTLASAWGTDGDLAHQYKVKVWDNTGTVSPAYSDALALYPSAPVNPTVSAPLAAAVINQDTVVVTWTVAEQTGVRVALLQTTPAAVLYDSGPMIGYTDTSFTVPVSLPNGFAGTVQLWTYNNDQLPSTVVNRSFTVSYAPAPPPTPVLTSVPASGWVQVVVTNPTAVGVQPAVIDQDVFRRPRTTAALNSNPTMAGNVTGWQTGGGGGAGTLSYSTTQSVSVPGSARMVPGGAVAIPQVESTPTVTVVAGALYYACGWVRPDTSNKPVRISLAWYTAGLSYIDATVVVVPAVGGAWQFLEVYGNPGDYPTAARVSVTIGETSTPAGTDAFYVDNAELRVYNPAAGVRIAAGAAPGATINDWGPASGVDYEYRVVAKGGNGTTSPGPWTG